MKSSNDSWEKKIQPDDLKFRDQVVEFVKQKLPIEAQSPRERTWGASFGVEEGGPVYVNVSLDWQRGEPKCCLTFNQVAVDTIGEAISLLKNDLFDQPSLDKDGSLPLILSKDKWEEMKGPLSEVLEDMVRG